MRNIDTKIIVALGLLAALMAGSEHNGLNYVEAQVTKTDTTQADERVYMLNALWFKEDGGQEKYAEYIAAASPFVAKHGGKSNGAFIPEAAVIGEFDADLFFVVEWPNEAAFLALVQDPEYQKINHLREEAIRDSLLIRCRAAE